MSSDQHRDYETITSFVDDETFLCPRPLNASHINEDCSLLPDRFELIARLPKGGRIAEVGTQAGKFAQYILATCCPAELHLFDLSFNQEQFPFDHQFFNPYVSSGIVFLHEGDSSQLLSAFPDEYFDWIYIDANHSLEGVRRDIAQVKIKMRPDGYLVFDDYTIYSPLEKIQYGVQVAVNDLCIEDNFEILYFALSNRSYHNVCLRRRR